MERSDEGTEKEVENSSNDAYNTMMASIVVGMMNAACKISWLM
jgi:hypothetical protein